MLLLLLTLCAFYQGTVAVDECEFQRTIELRDPKMQQTELELWATAKILKDRAPCNFLVFGLGYDTPMWMQLNQGGRTVFLEQDNEAFHQDHGWFKDFTRRYPMLEAYVLDYTKSIRVSEHDRWMRHLKERASEECRPVQDISKSSCKLALTLPKAVLNTTWDVILIDAPNGHLPDSPGRMSAIYTSSVLARSAPASHVTDISVHDCNRPAEDTWTRELLCFENERERAGRIRRYRLRGTPDSTSPQFCASCWRVMAATEGGATLTDYGIFYFIAMIVFLAVIYLGYRSITRKSIFF